MDLLDRLLDRLLGHNAWTTRALLTRCAALTDEQLDIEFDIGHRTIRRTLQHILTHSTHHRAQLLYMMRALGLRSLPDGDVLSWERQNS